MAAGALLRDVRLRHGLSQADLARRACTTARQVGRIEREEVSPSIRTLQRLMRAMGEELQLSAGAAPTAEDPVLAQARVDLRDLTVAQRAAQAMALSRMATTIAAASTAAKADRHR
jgi:transcriptional regulator with XRE-family HTH domain